MEAEIQVKPQYETVCKQMQRGQFGPAFCFIADHLKGQALKGGSEKPGSRFHGPNGPHWDLKAWNDMCELSLSTAQHPEKTFCGNCPRRHEIKPLIDRLTQEKQQRGELTK